MALGVTYDSLRTEVAYFIGIKKTISSWSTEEARIVDSIIDKALRRFYWPSVVIPEGPHKSQSIEQHKWSFLSPDATLTTVAGTDTYDLPAGFTDMASRGFTFATGQQKATAARILDETLQALKSQANRSGPPQFYSISPKAVAEGSQTRYEVRFYPTPDAAYVLTYMYGLTPESLSEVNQVPLGGARHSQTILQACLAEAEKSQFDEYGQQEKRFQEYLTASIMADKGLVSPEVEDVWPFENQATDLTITKAYLKRLIGQAIGAGPHPGTWSHTESQKVKLALETGLRKFYSPPILPGDKYSHNWSFLKKSYSLTLVEDQFVYDLPEGFAMLSTDEILHEPGTAQMYPPIPLMSEREIMRRNQQILTAGRPQAAAYRPKSPDQNGTRFELLLWPTPDSEYVLNIRYTINPGMISEEAALPYGNQSASQAIVEACLAAAEEQGGSQGLHSKLFMEALAAAVSQDRKVNSPDTLGFNQDRSDVPEWDWPNWHNCNANIITYNGNVY